MLELPQAFPIRETSSSSSHYLPSLAAQIGFSDLTNYILYISHLSSENQIP